MVKIPNWLIYALICSLLYGLWGFFGKLATKSIDYKTAFVYEAIGATLTTIFIKINMGCGKLNGFSLEREATRGTSVPVNPNMRNCSHLFCELFCSIYG